MNEKIMGKFEIVNSQKVMLGAVKFDNLILGKCKKILAGCDKN
jgi:hypothetical protein